MSEKKPFGYWTYERCLEMARQCHSKSELRRLNVSALNSAVKNGWIDDYVWFEVKKKPNGYWNKETCYEEAKKYSTRSDFQRQSKGAYLFALKEGWLDDYTWFKPLTGYWTYEACKTEAAKYDTRGHFKIGARGAYTKSRVNGWLDEFFPKE